MDDRRYLDEPWLVERLALERARDALRQLAQDPQLPRALRSSLCPHVSPARPARGDPRTLPPAPPRPAP